MGYVMGIGGKGGTGKTTVAALLIKALLEMGKRPILAVDADPNSNLHESLGFETNTSIGTVLEEFMRGREKLPPGVPKESYLELKLSEVVVEGEGLDLLSMGRPEGPGCYCFPNLLLRRFVEMLLGNYPYIVIDNEAGMEHLSRRTTRKMSVMLITSDPTIKGVRTAGRLKRLAEEMELEIGRVYLVVDRVKERIEEEVEKEIKNEGLTLLGTIPEDELVLRFDMERRSLLELPPDSKAYKAMRELIGELGIP